MSARIVLMGGLGYPATETIAGMPTLKQRLMAEGAEILLIGWDQRQEAYNFLHGFPGFRGLMGDSLGAGSAAQYAGDQKGQVQYAGGFQPSIWDSRAQSGLVTVAANVVRAHCVYDPVVPDTGGLGAARYVKAHGASTILFVTEHRGAHPDDWGWSQDLLFNEVKALLTAPQ